VVKRKVLEANVRNSEFVSKVPIDGHDVPFDNGNRVFVNYGSPRGQNEGDIDHMFESVDLQGIETGINTKVGLIRKPKIIRIPEWCLRKG
jgi:hypothetical protein